jgi:hypothetical protein
MDLLEELKKLSEEFDRKGVEYALCGGLAIAIYAKPRATLDIDMMIDPSFLFKASLTVKELGFDVSGEPMVFQDGTVVIHRFVKIDVTSGEHLVLDLLMVTPKTKKAWDGRITVAWEGGPLKVLSPQGLILLKSFRNSGQDQDDIEYLRSIENEDRHES